MLTQKLDDIDKEFDYHFTPEDLFIAEGDNGIEVADKIKSFYHSQILKLVEESLPKEKNKPHCYVQKGLEGWWLGWNDCLKEIKNNLI